MTDLLLSALTDDQRARVTYLFADDVLGTDANAFAYEVNERGEITGRHPLQQIDVPHTRVIEAITLQLLPEPNVTPQMGSRVASFIDRMAAALMQEQVDQSVLQEVA